jgi:hypothetical protein
MKIKILLAVFFGLSSKFSFSQDATQSRVIHKYYTYQTLKDYESNFPKRLQDLWTYFHLSYLLEVIDPNPSEHFLPELFDIKEYEHFRQESERVEIVDTNKGFKLILLSQRELIELYDGSKGSITENLPSSYPQFEDTGNPTEDQQAYLNNILLWKEQNQGIISQLESKYAKHRISAEEYQTMPQSKKNLIQAQDFLYLID